MSSVTICDGSASGKITHQWTLEVLTERISVRELIRSRVYQEVQDYNQSQPEFYRGLVQPTDAEVALNGFRLPKRKQIDWQEQFESALNAFQQMQILLLVDDKQISELDDQIDVRPDTRVSFLKLMPLVGG